MHKSVKNNQIKSKERVAKHGEVFTADKEVNAMVELVGSYIEEIATTVLESKTQNLIQINDCPLRGVA